ncbi:hybrid sensor histidine kinase/response regulator [uncultured Aquabacterium sp.]|uniref:ATP-binding response regulator n=1 Tax=Aquabacterium sp. TaxID=1872578 RepID=UPI0025F782CA|nr:hybrid sensor histidine kinase/response regulator [uncultured Aquabacterium sp.]
MSPLRPSLREAWQFERPRLLVAQMTLLDGNLSGAFVVSCIVSWLTAAAFVLIAEDLRAVWWALLTTAVSVGCLLVRKVLPPPDDVARVARYAQAVRVMAALLGCCRGAMAPWLMDAAHPESITLVLGMSAGMSSGGLAVFAPSWPVAMAYWVCSVLPVAITLLDLGGAVNVTLGLGVLIYLWAMTVFSYHTSRMALRSITLRFENEGLIQRLRDQTERAMAARQIAEDALDEAEEANRAKTVFLASASHDLRQPLHALTLTLATLGRTPLTPRQQQLLAHASASADAAGEMLHTLLDFAKIDAGVVRPAPQPFALQGTFDKLSREFTPLADAKGLGWRARPTGCAAYADPALVEVVLRNLLLNAVRYTERGRVLLAARSQGPHVAIEVWDTGIGIPEAEQPHVFKAFHQVDNPERDRHKGLGLGLSIVDGLARAMGAEVDLRSRPGRGSVFRLILPATAASMAAMPPVMPVCDLRGLRVLLVDDDEPVRQALGDLLTDCGCWCEAVDSLEAALHLLRGFTPEVLLVDYRLRAHRNGVQAVEAIRAELGRAVPAILVTGDTAPERLREAHASGLTLLHKPVPAAQLLTALQAVLTRRASPRQAAAT